MDQPVPARSGSSPVFAPAIGLREVLEAAPDLVFCCDASGRFAWASSAFEQLAGLRASDIVGQSYVTLVPASDRLRVLRMFRRQLRKRQSIVARDFALQRRDGTRVEISARVRLYERPDGDRYFIGVARERQEWSPGSGAADPGAAVLVLEGRVRELQRQLEEAHEGGRLKGEVLTSLADQLRPPMDAVMGASTSLLASALAPEQSRLVNVIRSAGLAQLTLVSDAHDHSQLETGQMSIENISFDLRVTLEQVEAVLSPMAAARSLALEIRADALLPSRLKGDPGRLRQVLLNLGANAIRSGSQGAITLDVDRESEDDAHVTLLFGVSEPGTGSASEHRAQLFSEQLPHSSTPPSGEDLGLSISRRLVHLMGGKVGAEVSEGEGNTFWFRLTFEKQVIPAVVTPAPAVRAFLTPLRRRTMEGVPARARARHVPGCSLLPGGCDEHQT